MFGWIKKRILKSIINEVIKELPKYQDFALCYVEQHMEEIIKKVLGSIKDIINTEIAKALNK